MHRILKCGALIALGALLAAPALAQGVGHKAGTSEICTAREPGRHLSQETGGEAGHMAGTSHMKSTPVVCWAVEPGRKLAE